MVVFRDYSKLLPLSVPEICKLMTRIFEDETGCWLWMGAIGPGGYGRLWLRGKLWAAHRVAQELFGEHIPPDHVVHHKCRNRRCCNPRHLEAVSQQANVREDLPYRSKRSPAPPATHCKYGHPLTGDNVVLTTSGARTRRLCRICMRNRARKARNRSVDECSA